jgi:glyoxylase-like metal-dependent hydrolase (beta-lactamase superfamily II)
MPDWKITPLVVALGPQREKSRFTYMHNFGEKVDIPYVSWLLQDGTHNVLVDTGCSAADYAAQVRPADGPLMLAGERFADVQDVVPIEQRLSDHRLEPADIDLLIQTHLDWDHTMNTPKFDRTRIVVQTAQGPHVIVGMCTIAENFFPPEEVLKKGTYKVIPTGMHIDPIVCYDSMLAIKAIPEARILPFHDIAVLEMDVLG